MIVNFIATGSVYSFKRDESRQTHADPDPKHWEEQTTWARKEKKTVRKKNGGDKKNKSQEKLMISPWAETRGKLLHWNEKGKHEPQPNELDHYQTPSEVDEIGEGN